jgi:hypothetical protein
LGNADRNIFYYSTQYFIRKFSIHPVYVMEWKKRVGEAIG